MLTRREFVAQLAAGGAAAAALPAGLARSMTAARAPVVSIHMDQPYVDVTGRALPYLPPAGMRGGAAVAHLNEREIRSNYLYF